MPDAPQIQHQVILPDVDFVPRPHVRGVLVYLRIDKVQELYAVPLATRTSAYGLYFWAGILPICQQTPTQCGAWINGNKIYGASSARLTHADYVKIAYWQLETDPEELQPITLRDYDPIQATYTEGSPYRTVDMDPSDDDVVPMQRVPQAPIDAMPSSDLYWILAAIYVYAGGLLLLRCQLRRHRSTKKPRAKRETPTFATWLFIGLLLSQHVQPVATMMIRHRAVHEQQPTTRLHNPLPPPGNVVEDTVACLQLTEVGQQHSRWIADYITMKNQAKQIWMQLGLSSPRAEDDLRDEIACTVQAPQDLHRDPSHPPILPIAETAERISVSLTEALGLTDAPVGSRQNHVVSHRDCK